MSKDQLLAEILRLPLEERRQLLQEASESLETLDPDPDMTPEFRAELERRIQDIHDRPDAESSWQEVSARLLARTKKRT